MPKRKRATTLDRDSPGMELLVEQQLSPRMSMTPEGFLLCEEVPIARTGEMLYGPGETPVAAGPEGFARVTRGPEDLFSTTCIASFNGKPVVDEHPDEDVTPKNWTKYAKGYTFNVRRGELENADVLLADLLITDAQTIADVRAGKRELSCGYDADYETTGVGTGRQRNIIGNHVALVRRGRCGPRCAIGDSDSLDEEGTPMTVKAKGADVAAQREKQRRRAVLRKTIDSAISALAEDAEDEIEDVAGGDVHIHVHGSTKDSDKEDEEEDDKKGKTEDSKYVTKDDFKALVDQVTKVADTVAKLATKDADPEDKDDKKTEDEDKEDDKEKTEDEAEEKEGKTNDSAALQSSFAQMLADAEILVPGFRLPTFDAAAPRKRTVDAMCNARRKALDICYATADGKTLIDSVASQEGDVDFMSLDCAAVATVFKAAAGAKKLLNNRAATGDAGRVPNQDQNKPKGPRSIAELNAMFRKHYGQDK